jgi:hypothetical protein
MTLWHLGTSFLGYLLYFTLGFDGGSSGHIKFDSSSTSMATAAAAMGSHTSMAMAMAATTQW